MAGPHLGSRGKVMLAKLLESPNGDAGFRDGEWSPTVVKNGWAKPDGELGRIKWFTITDAGREAYNKVKKRPG